MNFDTEALDDVKQTPLHHAILASNTGVAQALIEKFKACKSAKDGRNNTPLMFAVQKNLKDVAQALLDERDPCAIDETNDDGESAIHLANTRPMAKLLVDKNCSISITDKNGRTALHTAIHEKHDDVALYLLEVEPRSESSLRVNEPLLVVACRSGNCTLISKLLERWPDIINLEDERYGQSPLSWACEKGHYEAVQELLKHRYINVNHTASRWRNYTPLHFSAGSNSPKIIKLLLQQPRIEPNKKDNYDRSPLGLAMTYENLEAARELLLHHGTAFEEKVRYFGEFIVDLPQKFESTIILSVLQGIKDQSLVSEFVLRVFNDIVSPNTLEKVKVFAEALKGGAWKDFDFPYRIAAPLGVPELVKALSEQGVEDKSLDEDNWSSADYIQRFDRTGELSAIVANLQKSGGNKTGHKVPTTLAWADYKDVIEVTPHDDHNDCSKVHDITVVKASTSVDRACIRSENCIPPSRDRFYFEIEVLQGSEDGIIGIGFCGLVNSNDEMPGWFRRSWGYHGDDGKLFIEAKIGTGSWDIPSADFGDSGKFGQGDVVGVGLDMRSGHKFCTWNGKRLDMGEFGLPDQRFNFGKLYPCVGFSLEDSGVGLHFRVNFDGSNNHPFKFNNDC